MYELTDQPFGVNLPLLFLKDDSMLEFCVQHGVNFVTTSAGDPSKYIDKLKNKKIAVIANNTSIVRSKNSSIHLIDTLIKRGIEIKKIFSPEHGFLGDKDDGEK